MTATSLANKFKGLASLAAKLPALLLLGAGTLFGFNRSVMEGLPATNNAILVSTGSSPATSNVAVQNLTVKQLAPNQCVQTGFQGLLTVTGNACGFGVAGSSNSVNLAGPNSIGYYSANVTSNTISGVSPGVSGQLFETLGSGSAPVWTNVVSTLAIVSSATVPSTLSFPSSNAITLGNNSVRIGSSVGGTGQYQVCEGVSACASNASISNIGIGFFANSGAVGLDNIGIGDSTLETCTGLGVTQNTAIGDNAISLCNNNPEENTAIGYNAMPTINAYGENTAIGANALFSQTIGTENTAVGVKAMGGNIQGLNNVAVGNFALYESTNGNSNVAIGHQAAGYDPGFPPQPSWAPLHTSNGVYIGEFSGVTSSGAVYTDAIAIGKNARVAASNTAQIGGTGTDAVTLHVASASVDGLLQTGTLTLTGTASGTQCLHANGSGQVSGTGSDCGAGGGGGTPGGSSPQLQYNNSGVFGGIASTVVTGSSVSFHQALQVDNLTDGGLSASLPVLTDANKQLTTGNIPAGNISGTLAVGNGGTGLTSAANDSVLLGNGSAWTAGVIPSCSGSSQAAQFNTGSDAWGCLSSIGILGSTQTWTGADTFVSPSGLSVTYGITGGSVTVNGPGAGELDLTEGSAPSGVASSDVVWGDTLNHWVAFNPNNAGIYVAAGSSGTVTAGHCAQYSGTGSLIDPGFACLSPSAAGTANGFVNSASNFAVARYNSASSTNVLSGLSTLTFNGSTLEDDAAALFTATFTVANVSSTTFTNISTFSLTSAFIDFTGSTATIPAVLGTITASTAAVGMWGEYLSTSTAANVTSFPSTGNFGDLVSMTISSGDWNVSAVLGSQANGGTVTSMTVGISTTSGNNSGGMIEGDSLVNALGPTAATDTFASIPDFYVNTSTTTIYYLKFKAAFSVATPKAVGRLSARRMR